MTEVLVAELGARPVARPGPRRRHRAVAVPARCVQHRRSGRSRSASRPPPTRCRPAFASQFATVVRSSPAAREPASPAGPSARRRGHDRHDEDEPRAVGGPSQPAGLGRAGGAQPRPHRGRHALRPALRPRPQQPAELLDRRQRRQQLRRAALPVRRRHDVRTSSDWKWYCPTARSLFWVARSRSPTVTTCAVRSSAVRACAASPPRCACG